MNEDTPPPASGATAPTKAPKKKKSFLRRLLSFLVALLLVPVAIILILAGWAFFNGTKASVHIQEDVLIHARIENTGEFLVNAIQLRAIDTALEDPSLADLRQLVRTVRGTPALGSWWFKLIAAIPVDASLYPDNEWGLAVDLGLRSGLLPPAMLALSMRSDLLDGVRGLRFEEGESGRTFIFETEGMTVYAAVYKDLILAAPSRQRLELMRVKNRGTRAFDMDAAIEVAAKRAGSREGARILAAADSSRLSRLFPMEGIAAKFMESFSFGGLTAISLDLSNKRAALKARLPVEFEGEAMKAVFARRSKTPASLSRIPASARWYSLLSMASAQKLWEALEATGDEKILDAWKLAQKGTKAGLGLSMEDLLFSWMGEEYGVFGMEQSPLPVFFVSVADEKQRKRIFDTLFSSVLLERDLSILVGETRVPRIGFPPFINSFLKALGIDLPSPFYLVHDGVLYASTSAELLAATVKELENQELLVRSDHWKESGAFSQAESSASLFYSLDRSLPFFLRGKSLLQKILKLYGRGLATLSTGPGAMEIVLNAVPGVATADETGALPGYPIKSPIRLSGTPLVARDKRGDYWAFCAGKADIIAIHLPSARLYQHSLDGDATLAIETSVDASFAALWAVSDRGSIYRFKENLETHEGFPILSGEQASGPPSALEGTLYLPIAKGPGLLIVQKDGKLLYSDVLHERQRHAPTPIPGALVLAPRSFDSLLYTLDRAGHILPLSPAELPSIVAGSPLAFKTAGDAWRVAVLTEAGDYQLFALNPDQASGPEPLGDLANLPASFQRAPVWLPASASLVALSQDGTLYRFSPEGVVLAWAPSGLSGRDLAVTTASLDGGMRDTIFIAGSGDQVMAYDLDLRPLPGFPIPGESLPAFPDLNRDGRPEILTRGMDDRIHIVRYNASQY